MHFPLQTAWFTQSNSAVSSHYLFFPFWPCLCGTDQHPTETPTLAQALRKRTPRASQFAGCGSEQSVSPSTPRVLQVFWQASRPVWAQAHAHLQHRWTGQDGCTHLGQLRTPQQHLTHRGPAPPHQNWGPEVTSQVTLKLCCSLYRCPPPCSDDSEGKT